MSMGRRPDQRQADFWIATTDLAQAPGHVFYDKLNKLLAEADFDRFVESLCQPYYADHLGRESIPPGTYFRMLFVGYFEGLDSQRAIAWRCSDSLSLRAFLGIPLNQATPDHSSLTVIKQRLPLQVHEQVFAFALGLARQKKLLRGKTVAVVAHAKADRSTGRQRVPAGGGEPASVSPGHRTPAYWGRGLQFAGRP